MCARSTTRRESAAFRGRASARRTARGTGFAAASADFYRKDHDGSRLRDALRVTLHCPHPDASHRRRLPRPLPHRELPRGTLLWRVHERGLPCDTFVTGDGDPDDPEAGGRFDPLPHRKRVPVLYAASSPHAAIAESLVHIDPRGVLHPCTRADAEKKAISKLLLRKPLRIVAFHGLDVHRFPLKHRDLAESGQRDYPATRAGAALFRSVDRRAQGLGWISRQDNTACSFVFFGDRAGEDAVEPQGRAFPLYSGAGQRWVGEVLERMGTRLRR